MNTNPVYIPANEKERQDLLDRIYGGLMGFAIGDALGKGAALMSREEIDVHYPQGLHSYSQIIRDAHRSLWAQNEWSSPTELMLVAAQSLCSSGGFDPIDMAVRLKRWNEATGDIISIMHKVMSQPDYETNPEEASRRVWNSIHRPEASNEALGRAMVLGIWGHDLERNLAPAITLTHNDTRCTSAGIAIALMARDLLWTGKPTPITKLKSEVDFYDERVMPYFEKAYRDDISDFNLDDEATYWYVRKTMCTALWAVHRCHDMEEALTEIIHLGGSAEYNASLALGLMGLHQGSAGLPKRLEETIAHPEKIRRQAEDLLDAIIRSMSDNEKEYQP